MITPFWPPLHGGAERYEYRLANNLISRGFNVEVLTGTSIKSGRDNGSLQVERFTPFGDYDYGTFTNEDGIVSNKSEEFRNRINHYLFIEKAVNWVLDNNFDIIIIGNALQMFGALFARELFTAIKLLRIPVGIIHHDLSGIVEQVVYEYYNPKQGWDTVKENAVNAIKEIGKKSSDLEALYLIRSPLFFRPDFVICNSEWTKSFIDPFSTTPKIVFHPMTEIISDIYSVNNSKLSPVDVLMINPQKRKNPNAMAALITESKNLTFRVLKGGWGDAFKTFLPLIKDTDAFKEGRVDLVDYVSDIGDAYRSAKVMFFPSLAEGYGMAAVEPMYLGTPVLSSNYPAIIEGVGDAALTLCPHSSSGVDWNNSLMEIINNYAKWKLKASERVDFLKKREDEESTELIVFLKQFLN